jgi:hypothetical protein
MVAVGDGEPTTFEKAKREQCWLKAMKEEMGSIKQNSTWKLVDLPRGHRAIGLKCVFKVKHDEQGAIVKHKARLIAKGYVQQQGVDFDEVFAPCREDGVDPDVACRCSTRGLVCASYGCQISISEWRAQGGSVCPATTRFCRYRP